MIYEYLCFHFLLIAYSDVMSLCGFYLTIHTVTMNLLALHNVFRLTHGHHRIDVPHNGHVLAETCCTVASK
jgi:hypothetical protein